jgi:soluble lytic murein transglycosylase-like protein
VAVGFDFPAIVKNEIETIITKHMHAGLSVLIVVSIAFALLGCSKSNERAQADTLQTLVAAKWGNNGVLLPSATSLVQYEADFGERWTVDFEKGSVVLECLWPVAQDLNSAEVRDCMCCAVSNVFLSEPVLPEIMLSQQQSNGYVPAASRDALTAKGEDWVYTVRKGDTLSAIASKYRVTVSAIVEANDIRDPNRVRQHQVLKIPESPPHIHLAGEDHALAEVSLLRGQLRDPDTGEAIDVQNIGAFSKRIIERNGVEHDVVVGADGRKSGVARVRFSLVENHLEVRARQYYPVVKEYAETFGHDPAVIMAMIHTESAFNPMAKSPAGAYGLMQIVPSSGGREANKWLHSKDVAPSRAYLLQPKRNIELGSAYMQVLQEKVFKGVKNSDSRLYCAVAAYNGGGGNVGRTFTGRKSVQSSLDAINAQSSSQVLETLKSDAPHQETRDYVERVIRRAELYRVSI